VSLIANHVPQRSCAYHHVVASMIRSRYNDNMNNDVPSEVAGLRAVWQQTRDQLARTKTLLLSKEEQYKKSLRERDALQQRALDEQKDIFDKEIAKLKKTIVQNQRNVLSFSIRLILSLLTCRHSSS
jgi:hypothetical protein